jgi:hypothetical protein
MLEHNPAAPHADASQFFDARFVQELDESGSASACRRQEWSTASRRSESTRRSRRD